MRYSGRDFSDEELELIRKLIAENPSRSRAWLSQITCRLLKWYKADGGLKEMSCRVAMLRMQDDGLIELPPPRWKRPKINIRLSDATDPGEPVRAPAHALPTLCLSLVTEKNDSKLWNEYIHRYHYLGYTPLPGAQLRYFIHAGQRLVALLGYGASAWQCAPRDQFIGWNHEQRQQNLHLVVNNARFLILPWVKSQNLASKILSLSAKRLPTDWEHRYNYRPVLLETFVERKRFTGTSYKAANWRYVGATKGRGKLGPSNKQSVPIKDIWLYSLKSNFKKVLVGSDR
jgi:hypothetical protein